MHSLPLCAYKDSKLILNCIFIQQVTVTFTDRHTRCLQFIVNKMDGRNDFTLVGYSYGCVIALEIARRLEAKGMTGKLIFIDGSPDLMNSIVKQHLASNSDEELQSNILLGMMDVLDPTMSSEVSKFSKIYKIYKMSLHPINIDHID
jgi:thioesterase domain-containing protein